MTQVEKTRRRLLRKAQAARKPILERLEDRTLLAAGALDPTFGTGGKVITDFGGSDFGQDAVILAGNKILVGGGANGDFGLARYNSDGSLDPTFGTAGKVTTDFGSASDFTRAIVVQSDGKILAFGSTGSGTGQDFALARYNPNGTLDTSFGTGGKVITDLTGQNDQAFDIALQSSGKIVVAGFGTISSQADIILARYDSNGTLDTTFGTGGMVVTSPGIHDFGHALAIQPDDKIIVAGVSQAGSNDFTIIRYNPSGSLDPSFGSGGIVLVDFGITADEAHEVALQSDGKIVVVGGGGSGLPSSTVSTANFALARLNTNGSLDTSFGSGGKVITPFHAGGAVARGVIIQPGGQIVVAGFTAASATGSDYDFALAVYNSNGFLDPSFGSSGKITTDFSSGSADHANPVAIQSDGKIVVAGESVGNFALARYEGLSPCLPPPSGLVSWWPGDSHANDIQGTNHGTLQNGATFAPGLVGPAFTFDGVDDGVVIPNSPAIDLTGDLTIEAWIKPTSTGGVFVTKGNGDDYVNAYQLRYGDAFGDQRLLLVVSDGGTRGSYYRSMPGVIPVGVFSHVAATIQGTTAKLYVNGVEVPGEYQSSPPTVPATSLTANRFSDGGSLRIGRRGDSFGPFAGVVDEVAIYNRALSAVEIQAGFAAGSAGMCKCGPPPGAISWWAGNGNANDSAADNHGTLQSGTTFAQGLVAQAFSLDGVDDRVDFGDVGISMDTQPVSIAAWIRPNLATVSGGTRVIVANGGGVGGGVGTFMIHMYVGDEFGLGGVAFQVGYRQVWAARKVTASLLSADQWAHVVATYDGSRTYAGIRVYVNGVQATTTDGGSGFGTSQAPLDDWHLGAERAPGAAPGLFFGGLVDEAQVFNRVLTPAEISAQAACANAPPAANAGGPYTVGEGSTVTVTGSGSDPNPGDTLTYAWDLDNNGSFETPGQNVPFSAAGRDGPTIQTVALRVTDSRGLSATSSATVIINNVAPTATLTNNGPVNEGATATVTFSNPFDPSPADTAAGFRYSYDFNNDGVFEIVNSTSASATVPASFLADGPGTRIVRARIADTAPNQPTSVPPPSGLVGWWAGDGNANDLAGSNHGTLQNGATFGSGIVGPAFQLDGVNDHVTIPDSASLRPSTMTLSAWIRTSDVTALQPILAKALASGNWNSYQLRIQENGKIMFEVDHNSQGRWGSWVTSSVVIAPNTWYHVTATWANVNGNSTDAKIYINGVEQTTTFTHVNYSTTFTPEYNTLPVFIGRAEFATGFFKGSIDEADIYNRVLSASEVQSIYNAGSAGKIKPSPGFTDYTTTITINNVSPTATLSNSGPVNEGSTATVTFSSQFDPSPVDTTAGFRYSYDFNNDGVFEIVNSTSASATVPASFLADGPGTRTVRARIADKDADPSAFSCEAPANLVSWWAGEGNANDLQGLNHGTLRNGTTFVAGRVGQAFSFDGIDDDVRIPASASLNIGATDFTLDAWIRTTNANDGYIFSKRAGGVFGIDTGVSAAQGGRVFYVLGPDNRLFGTTSVTDGQWHHVAFVRSIAHNQMWLYVDGNLEVSGPQTTFGDADLYLGRHAGNSFPFQGQIDEADLFNRALSAAEIQAIFAAGSGGKCQPSSGFTDYTTTITIHSVAPTATLSNGGPVAEGSTGTVSFSGQFDPSSVDTAAGFRYSYDFNNDGIFEIVNSTSAAATVPASYLADGPGSRTIRARIADKDANPPGCVMPPANLVSWWAGDGNANDIQAFNHGTPRNGTTFVPGLVGPAFSFDGIDDDVRIPASTSINISATDFTLDAWIRTTNANDGYIFSKRAGGVFGIDTFISAAQGGRVGFTLGPGFSLFSTTSVTDGQWHHVAFVRSTSLNQMRLYVDGNLEASGPQTTFGDADLYLGRHAGNSFPFQGQIDEADLFNRALSTAEIQSIAAAGSAGKCKSVGGTGTFTDYTTTITINNVPPTIALMGNATFSLGSPYTLTLGTVVDPGQDTVTAYTIDWGDGFSEPFTGSPNGAVRTHTYAAGPTSRTITVSLTDEDGTFTGGTKTITASNSPPTANAGGPYTVAEGGSVVLNGSGSSDPDQPSSTLTYEWDLDGDSMFGETGPGALRGNETGVMPTFSAAGLDGLNPAGSVAVSLRVTDNGGLSHTASSSVTITNVAPTATFANNGPVFEASPATISFSNQFDPSSADTTAGFHYTYALSAGGLASTYTGATDGPSRQFTFADNGSYTVYGRIFDKDNGSTDYTTTVVVNNVPPLVTAPANQSANPGISTTFQLGSFSDPGPDSPWAVDVDWGDTSSHTTFNATATGSLGSQPHTYAQAGTYTVTVKVTDKDSGFDSKSFTVTVGHFTFRAGSTGADLGTAVVTDAAGNVYVTGSFEGTVDFDPGMGAANLTSAGEGDIFLAKYSPTGALIWARRMGGSLDDMGMGLAVDGTGAVYTTGTFKGTADFDPGTGTANLISAGGSTDIFVSKLDSAGNFVWAKRLGGNGDDTGLGLALDVSGNVVTTGAFSGTADFNPGTATANLVSAGNTDVFVSKLDSAGNFVWAKRMGGSGNDLGLGIALDSSGAVHTTGAFSGTADFNPGTATSNLVSAGNTDVFVSKLDSAGNFVWARRMGGSGSDSGTGVALDSSGNVLTTGIFSGTGDFNPGTATFNLVSAGGTDIFVSKLNSAGNFVWAKRMGGSGFEGDADIAVDSTGAVYTTGVFFGTADFDPGAGTFNLVSAGFTDIAVSKLDSAGNFVWARGMGGTGLDAGLGIAVDGLGAVYTTGLFSGTADFDPAAGTFNLTSAGSTDIFVSKLSPPAGGLALHAAGPAVAGATHSEILTAEMLRPIVAEAIGRWGAAGIDPTRLKALASMTFEITELPDSHLGLTFPDVIQIDQDAFGYGWFIDSTPAEDSEFPAGPSSSAYGKMDLLTVVAHELGHVLGLEHSDEDELMAETLLPGVRYLPSQSHVDAHISTSPGIHPPGDENTMGSVTAFLIKQTLGHDFVAGIAQRQGAGSGPVFAARLKANSGVRADDHRRTLLGDGGADRFSSAIRRDRFFANSDLGMLDVIGGVVGRELGDDLD